MNKEFLYEMIHCMSPSGKEDMVQKCVYKHVKN